MGGRRKSFGLTSSEKDARKLRHEKSETDANRGEESAFVFFRGEHEDGEDKLGSQKHLDDCCNVS